MRVLIGALCFLQAAFVAPQFVTFKDGKIGVNFGGYNAEAGLGGLLTGNAAHGGLSASAGTPWGPRAAAGLGGNLDGRTSGIAYAGAEANPSVGASAVLGGSAGEHGFAGSEAHANGQGVVKMHSTSNHVAKAEHTAPLFIDSAPVTSAPQVTYVQKVKLPKKFTLFQTELDRTAVRAKPQIINNSEVAAVKNVNDRDSNNVSKHTTTSGSNANEHGVANNDATVVIINRERRQRKRVKRPRQFIRHVTYVQEQSLPQQQHEAAENQQKQLLQNPVSADDKVVHTKKYVKSVQVSPHAVSSVSLEPASHATVGAQASSGVVFNALNIPIGILRSLQESLGGVKSGSVSAGVY